MPCVQYDNSLGFWQRNHKLSASGVELHLARSFDRENDEFRRLFLTKKRSKSGREDLGVKEDVQARSNRIVISFTPKI